MKNYLLAPFNEFKFMDEAKGTFEGYGSTFGNVDDGRDIVEKGAFTRTLEEHKAGGTMPSMFFSHNSNEPIGDWQSMEEDKKGLFCKGQLWVDDIEKARQAYRMLKGNSRKGLSIGYGVALNGSSYDPKAQVRHLKDLDLWETSPTPFPMNRKAVLTSIKSTDTTFCFKATDGTLLSKRDIERVLRDGGLSESEAKKFLAKGYGALDPRDVGDLSELLQVIRNNTHA